MTGVRTQGALILALGLGLVGAGLLGNSIDMDAMSAALIPGPALTFVGINMLVWPGSKGGAPRFDFVDWFEALPTAVRVRYFVSTGMGFALGLVLTLYLSDWDLLGLAF